VEQIVFKKLFSNDFENNQKQQERIGEREKREDRKKRGPPLSQPPM
jgi:hypothetical protein